MHVQSQRGPRPQPGACRPADAAPHSQDRVLKPCSVPPPTPSQVQCSESLRDGGFEAALHALAPVAHVALSRGLDCAAFDQRFPGGGRCCPQAAVVADMTAKGQAPESKEVTFLQVALWTDCFRRAAAAQPPPTHIIRARPDMGFWAPVPASVLSSDSVVTNAKRAPGANAPPPPAAPAADPRRLPSCHRNDALGSDMFFAFPTPMLASWWEPHVFPYLWDHNGACDRLPCCPEYFVFGQAGLRVRQDWGVQGALVRHTDDSWTSWDGRRGRVRRAVRSPPAGPFSVASRPAAPERCRPARRCPCCAPRSCWTGNCPRAESLPGWNESLVHTGFCAYGNPPESALSQMAQQFEAFKEAEREAGRREPTTVAPL